MIFIYLPIDKKVSSFSPSLSRPTFCILTKSNPNIADSLSVVSSYRDMSSTLILHVSNLIHFRFVRSSK
jgi:hypothetical protein